MVNYERLRKKFPVKRSADLQKHKVQIKKSIAVEYQRKRAELGIAPSAGRRGIRYYLIVIIGMVLICGLVGSSIYKRGGIDLAGMNHKKARDSVANIAIALGRYRYHVGVYPTTEQGIGRLTEKQVKERGWLGPYIKAIKNDPWGNEYVYENNAGQKYPVLFSKGPDGTAGTVDDIIPSSESYELPFRDTSWTDGWVPWHLRDVILADSKLHKEIIERQVAAALGESALVLGEIAINDGWEFLGRVGGNAKSKVELPFDWKALGSCVPKEISQGVFKRGLAVPEDYKGAFVALRISDVKGDALVRVNGIDLAVSDIGRDGYECDLTKHLKYGTDNIVEIVVKSGQSDGGAGVIGDVSLVVEDMDGRVVAGSTRVETKSANENNAELKVERKVIHFDGTNATERLESKVFNIKNPRLWTPEKPRVNRGNMTGRYVIRKMEPSSDSAVMLNGAEYQIKGVALCLKFGIMGCAINRAQVARILSGLKDVGVNAVLFLAGEVGGVVLEECENIGLIPFSTGELKKFALKRECFIDIGNLPTQMELALVRARYNPIRGKVDIYPHWSWADGAVAKVKCIADADSVEFFVNGDSQGAARKAGDCLFEADLAFEAGEVKAMAKKNGVYYGQSVVTTADVASALRFDVQDLRLEEGGVVIVDVLFTDERGRHVPNIASEVEFLIEDGPGVFVASEGAIEQSSRRKASCRAKDGVASVAVKRLSGSGVPLRISAKAQGVRRGLAIIPR